MDSNNPTITLDNFYLMGDDSVIHYAENVFTRKRGGKRNIAFGNYCARLLNEHTTTVTNNIAGNNMSSALALETVSFGNTRYIIWLDESMNMWLTTASNPTGQKIWNGNETCYYPSIKALGNGDTDKILFSHLGKMGVIYKGKATGGSSTTLVDSARNFTAGDFAAENGHGALAAGDRIYNITQNKIYTIDTGGIAATTLTITALDSGTGFSDNDYYVIVNPDWCDLDDDKYAYGRQICEHRGYYFTLNGDYVSMYDGTTFTADYKLLETNWIGRTISSSGSMLAVGANNNYRGKIYFWALGVDGWKNILSVDDEVQAIIPYGEAFIFVSGNGLWYTDGYSKTKITTFPDLSIRSSVTTHPNAITKIEEFIILSITDSGLARNKSGIYAYNLTDKDVSFIPYLTDTDTYIEYGAYGKIILFDSDLNSLYYSVSSSSGTSNQVIGKLYLDSSQNKGSFFTIPIKIGVQESIKKIEVNTVSGLRVYENYDSATTTIDCKLNDCKRPLWGYAQIYSTSTELNIITVRRVNGQGVPQVGDEVLFRDGLNSMVRRSILSMTETAGSGYTKYVITLDSALSSLAKVNENIQIIPFQRYGMETVTLDSSSDYGVLEFNPDFTSDNVMIEVSASRTGSPVPLEVESINIYI